MSGHSIDCSMSPEGPVEILEVHFKTRQRYALHLKKLHKLKVQGGKTKNPTFIFSIPADHTLYSDLDEFKARVILLYSQPDDRIFTVEAVISPLWNRYKAAMDGRRGERLAEKKLLSVSYTPQLENIRTKLRKLPLFQVKRGESPLNTFEFILENKDFADRAAFMDHVVEIYGNEGNDVFEDAEVMRSLYRLWLSARAKVVEFEPASDSDD
jgi:hypothetical protein